MLKISNEGTILLKVKGYDAVVFKATDPVYAMLDAFIRHYKEPAVPTGAGLVSKDMLVDLLLTDRAVYILEETHKGKAKDKPKIYKISEDIDAVASELIEDISQQLEEISALYSEGEAARKISMDAFVEKTEELESLVNGDGNLPELGHLMFGRFRGGHRIIREKYQEAFLEFLADIECDEYGYAVGKKAKAVQNERGGIKTETFEINPYYWGESEDEAEKHNFVFYSNGGIVGIDWYKYPLRDSFSTEELSDNRFREIINECRACFERIAGEEESSGI